MKRKLSSLQPNEAIYIANKKEAKALKLPNNCFVWLENNIITTSIHAQKHIDKVYPASDFIKRPKRKQELANFDNRLHAVELKLGLANGIETVSEHIKPTQLEVGKWYKSEHELMCLTKKEHGFFYGYGFHDVEFYKETIWGDNPTVWVEATPEEVSTSLINEAKRRYKKGDVVKPLSNYVYGRKNCLTISNIDFETEHSRTLFVKSTNGYFIGLFKDGQWAEIVEKPLTELPEKWAVLLTEENLPYVNEHGKYPPYVIPEHGNLYAHFPPLTSHHFTTNEGVCKGYTLLSPEDFKRLVMDAEAKDIDWSVPGQLVVNDKGYVWMTTGEHEGNSFRASYVKHGVAEAFKIGQVSFGCIKNMFKPYTGEPITLK